MTFAVGSLVKARGREWVVQPESTDLLLHVRPLGAPDLESTAIHTRLETVEPARFALPDPDQAGDTRSGRLLRDAVRLGFRASAGPFRSLGSISVEPRPYQLVPLLMALRQDPVRLLIADDVGIGKTVEAALIAKEFLARGEAERLCVLCPPHLAEQWQAELESKFSLEAVLVLPSTVGKLEKQCAPGVAVFEQFPVTVVSLDYIKSENRRADFLRTCPDMVIVDEAHTCTQTGQGAGQQRFKLLQDLARRPDRHMILVTATPHSGNEQAFRSLLSLLRPEFADLPDNLGGDQNRRHRERLAAHFVQRRRGDIAAGGSGGYREDTPFPARQEADRTYKLHPDYRRFLESALRYAREVVEDKSGTHFQQRIRWWSALALLRSISSSPAAAAATLRARANNVGSEDLREIEDLGRRSVMDLPEGEAAEALDVAPGAIVDPTDESAGSLSRRRLLDLARQAETLQGDRDAKLKALADIVKGLLADGYRPIVFCKFIPTAEYVAEQLRKKLRGVEIACVTGQLHHDEREARVVALAASEQRVLVCTDCLSEGINLQQHFDAVVHADLAWSPTRHEQREGRVDRFNQASPTVRVVTFYGEDNPIDGIVLNILIKKHKAIRSSTGVSVPVPVDSDRVLEAIFESLLLKGEQDVTQLSLFDGMDLPERKQLSEEWESAADREKRSRTLFAQHGIKADEVQPELDALRKALGSVADLERFVRDAVRASKGNIDDRQPFTIDLSEAPLALRDATGLTKPTRATFAVPPPRGALALSRTHPFMEALAAYISDSALSGDPNAAARRCGVTVTDAVKTLSTLLLLRFRFQIVTAKSEMLAEDCAIVAYRGLPTANLPQNWGPGGAGPEWLTEAEAEALLLAAPKGNLGPDPQRHFLRTVLAQHGALQPHLTRLAKERADRLLAAHRRVRKAVEGSHAAREIKVQGEPDLLGLYLFLPVGTGGTH
jgi:superfamily II DNA or RNA helicase